MGKIYKITKDQYLGLINLKENKKLANNIISKINRAKKSLNENVILTEAINGILLSYQKKGLLNETVIGLLKKSSIISNDQINYIERQ